MNSGINPKPSKIFGLDRLQWRRAVTTSGSRASRAWKPMARPPSAALHDLVEADEAPPQMKRMCSVH